MAKRGSGPGGRGCTSAPTGGASEGRSASSGASAGRGTGAGWSMVAPPGAGAAEGVTDDETLGRGRRLATKTSAGRCLGAPITVRVPVRSRGPPTRRGAWPLEARQLTTTLSSKLGPGLGQVEHLFYTSAHVVNFVNLGTAPTPGGHGDRDRLRGCRADGSRYASRRRGSTAATDRGWPPGSRRGRGPGGRGGRAEPSASTSLLGRSPDASLAEDMASATTRLRRIAPSRVRPPRGSRRRTAAASVS